MSSALRPDIIMWSPKEKKIILVELMVPWEEGCEEGGKKQMPATCPGLQG